MAKFNIIESVGTVVKFGAIYKVAGPQNYTLCMQLETRWLANRASKFNYMPIPKQLETHTANEWIINKMNMKIRQQFNVVL